MRRYYTVKEVANELEYSERAIRNMVKKGAIPHKRVRNLHIRIPAKWLNKMLEDVPTEKEYTEVKENIRFDLDNATEPEIKVNEVNQDMPKKEITNTEITTNKPKPKPFIPNPKKRTKKEVHEPEYADTDNFDNEPDSIVDDNDHDTSGKGFLDDYKGIGNW